MASFQDRVIGALRLQPSTYDEVARDTAATGQAITIVAVVSVAASLAFIRSSPGIIVNSAIWGLAGWAVFAGVIWMLGTRAIPGRNTKADFWRVLRPIGFAQTPRALLMFQMVRFVGWLIALVAWLWMFAATVVAVKRLFDYDDIAKALIVCVLAMAAFWAVMALANPGYVTFGY